MGIQVSSLSAGAVIGAAVQQEHPQERPPLPIERAASSVPVENYLPEPRKPEPADLRLTTSTLEHISLAFNRRLKFEVDFESKEILIKVIDNETDKVIKELPPEELKRLHSRIKETMGFLFDERV